MTNRLRGYTRQKRLGNTALDHDTSLTWNPESQWSRTQTHLFTGGHLRFWSCLIYQGENSRLAVGPISLYCTSFRGLAYRTGGIWASRSCRLNWASYLSTPLLAGGVRRLERGCGGCRPSLGDRGWRFHRAVQVQVYLVDAGQLCYVRVQRTARLQNRSYWRQY